MRSIVAVGAQWGDEGKGKVVDYLAASFDYIARYAGGHNASHAGICNGKKICSAIDPLRHFAGQKCQAVIGNGVVVDTAALVSELDSLGSGPSIDGGLHLSNRAHLIFPYHHQIESVAEEHRGAKPKIGTTARGIGPSYEDKISRDGLRVCDLIEPARFREKLARVAQQKDVVFRAANGKPLDRQRHRRAVPGLRRAPEAAGHRHLYLDQ